MPILQLALSGETLSEQQLFDLGANFLRTQLATVPGRRRPVAVRRQAAPDQVDLDPAALQARGLSPLDVVNALGAQNLILPAGTPKIGAIEYAVELNGSPEPVEELERPADQGRSTARTIYIRDVAHVRDGFSPQTNIVRVDGQRARC